MGEIIKVNIIDFKIIPSVDGKVSIFTEDISKTLYELDQHNLAIDNKPHNSAMSFKKDSYMWDWSKLPKSKIKEVFNLYKQKNWSNLMSIHNTYNLSDDYYCCSSYINLIIKAIKEYESRVGF